MQAGFLPEIFSLMRTLQHAFCRGPVGCGSLQSPKGCSRLDGYFPLAHSLKVNKPVGGLAAQTFGKASMTWFKCQRASRRAYDFLERVFPARCVQRMSKFLPETLLDLQDRCFSGARRSMERLRAMVKIHPRGFPIPGENFIAHRQISPNNLVQ